MATAIIARWDHLRGLVRSSRNSFVSFSPFYSRDGLAIVSASLGRTAALDFWTRLSLRDWASGAADPQALLSTIHDLTASSRPVTLFVNQSLHAKAFFSDAARALVGSANLTNGGFETNIELMVQLNGRDAKVALETLKTATIPQSKQLTAEALSDWIAKYSSLVERAKRNFRKGLQLLDDNQPNSDSDLGLSDIRIIEPTQETLDSFVAWLQKNRTLPGAAYLFELHEDRVIQRRQGHVKQCFAGVHRFLQEFPAWIQRLAAAAVMPNGIIEPDEWLIRDWSDHLLRHASDSNSLYSYSTLRAVLRPNLGGVLASAGGGASGTLKRMFPLVSLFISQQRGLAITRTT